MKYNEIKLTFISLTAKNVEDLFPFIKRVLPYSELKNSLSQINFWEILKKDTFFYFKETDIKTTKDKLISLIVFLLGKNFRSRLCSYRKIINNHLLNEKSPYKFILQGYHIYDLFSINTQHLNCKSFIFNLDGRYSLYLWTIEKLRQKIQHHSNKETKLCIVYNCFSLSFLRYLHIIYPNALIVSRYHDFIHKDKHKEFIKKAQKITNFYFESYSQQQALELHINYWPNSIDFKAISQQFRTFNSQPYDLYFLGSTGKSRLDFLKNLISILCKKRIKFHIDAVVFNKEHKSYINKQLMDIVKDYKSDSIVKVEPIPYATYMQNVANCKAVIDLYNFESNEGLSFRTAEALALKKKIITNRDLNANNLYKFKENILSFDDIDKVNLREFIDKPYVEPDPKLLKQFDINEQIKNYLKN